MRSRSFDSLRLFLIIPQRVEASKIEIGLVEARHYADASLELLLCLHVILLPYEKNAKIVQGFGIIRTQFDCPLQIARCALYLVLLGVEHTQTVVDFRIIGLNLQRTIQAVLCLLKSPLPPVDISQV